MLIGATLHIRDSSGCMIARPKLKLQLHNILGIYTEQKQKDFFLPFYLSSSILLPFL